MLIQEVAPEMGIRVELEPEFCFAGELIFPTGRRHLFRNTNFNVNPAGSTEIAKDKGYTNYFLRKHGFRVPRGQTFFSEKLLVNIPSERKRGLDDALGYAQQIGYPIFIKPNNLSQGVFVTKARNEIQIIETAHRIFTRTDVVLLEEPCIGRDYRVVVLGDKIISAYERRPLAVIGDGVSSIDELLRRAKAGLTNYGRPNTEIDPSDPRIEIRLDALGKSRNLVLPLNEEVILLDNANLSTGGTSVDVTDSIHPDFAAIAISASRTIGLRLSGVDFICADICHEPSGQDWNIIEINAAPGLDNYSSLGSVQAERVRNLYREVLCYLATHDA